VLRCSVNGLSPSESKPTLDPHAEIGLQSVLTRALISRQSWHTNVAQLGFQVYRKDHIGPAG
jgi:hypothetical protein